MAQLQEVYDRIKEFREKQKLIRDAYKSELTNLSEYQQIKDEIDALRIHKKEIENTIKQSMSADFIKLEDLKLDIDSDNELMTDLAFNQLMKGETIEITDEFGNKYVPIFRVKFEKEK